METTNTTNGHERNDGQCRLSSLAVNFKKEVAMTTNEYAIAHNLKGFVDRCGNNITTLRVRVTRRESGLAWVTTADLLDAGTQLVLDEGQVESEPSESVYLPIHKDGLVAFG